MLHLCANADHSLSKPGNSLSKPGSINNTQLGQHQPTCCLSASATLILLWRSPSDSRMFARFRRSASAYDSKHGVCIMPQYT